MSETRTVRLEVRRLNGWTTVAFEQITRLSVAAAPGQDNRGLTLTLIGHCPEGHNQVEPQLLEVAERHRSLVDSNLPMQDGEAYPVAIRDNISGR